jgi:hypothetical protein
MNDWTLRDELLRLETFSPDLRQKYEKELKHMIEKRLSSWDRVWWGWWALFGFAFMVGFGAMALIPGTALPWTARVGFGLGSLFGLMWMVSCLLILNRGTFHLRKDSFVLGGITWTFLVIMTVCSLMLGGQMPDTSKGILMIVSNLTFLVMFGLILTWGRIAESELRFRENFLRLELQLTELAENPGHQRKQGGTPDSVESA